jgi:putative transposase
VRCTGLWANRALLGVSDDLPARSATLSRTEIAFFNSPIVHWYRNVPSTKVREIAAMLKAIHASEDIVAARGKIIRVIEKLHSFRLSKAAELVETAVEETLTYYSFPEEHWRRIRTNNPLERILREIRM